MARTGGKAWIAVAVAVVAVALGAATTIALKLPGWLEGPGDAAKALLAAIKRIKPNSRLILDYTARVNALTAP